MKKSLIALTTAALLATGGSAFAADQKFNVSTNPFSLAIGIINAQVDYKVHDKITVAPTFYMWNPKVGSTEFGFMGYGARVNYHSKGAYQSGLYGSGVFEYSTFSAEYTDFFGTATGEASMTLFGAAGGYQWFWDNNMNMKLGMGYGLASAGDLKMTYGDGSAASAGATIPSFGLIFDLTVGYKF